MLLRPFQPSDYNLVIGDSHQILKTKPENVYDACICDPPYGIKIDKNWDNEVPATAHWLEVFRTLKPGAYCLSCAAPKMYHRLVAHIEQAGFAIQDMIVWIEIKKMIKHNRLKSVHEPICVAQKPYEKSIDYNVEKWGVGRINIDEARIPWDRKPPNIWDSNPNGRYPSNLVGYIGEEYAKYFYAPRPTEKEKGWYNDHKTVKPISLMAYLIKTFCPKDGVVVDPFMGTGSTGLAAMQERRKFEGIEINRHYVDIARKRLDDMMANPEPPIVLDRNSSLMRRRQEQAPFSEFISRHIG